MWIYSIKVFTEVCHKSSEKEDRQVGQSKENMATFDFVFMCMILYKEKCEIDCVSKTPQKKDIGLGESAFMFNCVCEHIRDLGNWFGQLKLEAESVERDRHQFSKQTTAKA